MLCYGRICGFLVSYKHYSQRHCIEPCLFQLFGQSIHTTCLVHICNCSGNILCYSLWCQVWRKNTYPGRVCSFEWTVLLLLRESANKYIGKGLKHPRNNKRLSRCLFSSHTTFSFGNQYVRSGRYSASVVHYRSSFSR